jgi:hypothetical protein
MFLLVGVFDAEKSATSRFADFGCGFAVGLILFSKKMKKLLAWLRVCGFLGVLKNFGVGVVGETCKFVKFAQINFFIATSPFAHHFLMVG